MSTVIRAISAISILFLVPGCIITRDLTLEALEQKSEQDIIVTTADGREITFEASEFIIVLIDSQYAVRGTGSQRMKANEPESVSFKGDIPFSSIELVQTREKTAFYYTGPFLVAVVVAIYFILHGNIRQ